MALISDLLHHSRCCVSGGLTRYIPNADPRKSVNFSRLLLYICPQDYVQIISSPDASALLQLFPCIPILFCPIITYCTSSFFTDLKQKLLPLPSKVFLLLYNAFRLLQMQPFPSTGSHRPFNQIPPLRKLGVSCSHFEYKYFLILRIQKFCNSNYLHYYYLNIFPI